MLKNIGPVANVGTTRKARLLRRQMTPPEVLLWQALRGRPDGFKFRRQHPSGVFVLDFFCSDARLAIEIDGEAHDRANRPTLDQTRDAWFANRGIKTFRIPAAEVLRGVDSVVRGVVDACRARLPLHHPTGGPPPRAKLGEDF